MTSYHVVMETPLVGRIFSNFIVGGSLGVLACAVMNDGDKMVSPSTAKKIVLSTIVVAFVVDYVAPNVATMTVSPLSS